MDGFDVNKFINLQATIDGRYEKRIQELRDRSFNTDSIESAVTMAISNIHQHEVRSFVIYGEPQSGKTEMMIALAARLLDEGHHIIVVLLNDSVQLLDQNLDRFLRSNLDPAPKKFNEILDPSVHLGGSNWIVFCKKNAADLLKLITKVGHLPAKVIIDDEADFATPNGKVNIAEKTRINELVGRLKGDNGIYIGVTATPARLDVNNTFDNDNRHWIDFPPHSDYTGHEVFFPTTTDARGLSFKLELMPDTGDDPKYLRNAFFSFLVNVAHLNLEVNESQKNYSMLIHTSGKKADHSKDYQQISNILSALRDPQSTLFAHYAKDIFDRAAKVYPGMEQPITEYVIQGIGQSDVIVMNSNSERDASYRRATSPASVFTIVIGGNIVSRGVTFDNLLSMFFTRDVKHRLQQDTYIQRARMFGSRGHYLPYFELHIPERLYFDWQTCFVFHKLALSSIRAGLGSPVWIDNSRVALTSSSSIDKGRVVLDSGEMSWDKFEYTDEIDQIVLGDLPQLDKLEAVARAVGGNALPQHLIQFVKNFQVPGFQSVAVHPTFELKDTYRTADVEDITRAKGFMAANTLEPDIFPQAIHHIKIFKNSKDQARVFYKYAAGRDKVQFYTRDQ